MPWRPPSEKESGVRLRIAIMCVARAGASEDIGVRFGDSGVRGDNGDGELGSL